MNNIKREDAIRLWIWCGFERKPHPLAFDNDGKMWRYPDGFYMPELPTVDLNNLYRYTIPKLQKEGHAVKLVAFECSGFVAIITEVVLGTKEIAHECADTPTEALYNAIMKVIDNEVK